ncbi:restriction endonuclease subunit S [Mesorhizobium sp. KR2-14]|uniref:restriction endonuclease subunit S n=1 Tax=Mesorhizobium sp. KR2-14 TaxID=3156610 RepID=UPI0032B41617
MSREVPEGWQASPIPDLLQKISKRIRKLQTRDYRDRGAIPIVDQGESIICGYTDDVDNICPVSLPVIVFGDHTRCFKFIDFPFAVGADGTQLLKPTSGLDPQFFFYALSSLDLPSEGYSRHFRYLKEKSILYPSLTEQRRIAEILSSVDKTIHATQAIIEQTRKVKQSVLKRLLTKGIGHTRFKQTEIGEIPEEWEVVSLADLAENSRNSFVIGPFGSNLVMSDYRDEGVPVVFVRDLRPGQFRWKSNVFVTQEKATQLQPHSVKSGDLVVTKMGLPPGIAALCPEDFPCGIVTADIIRLRPNRTKVDPAFLVELLNGDRARKAVEEITGGQTRPKITLRDYKNVKVALPQTSEQRLIREGIAPFQTCIEGQEEQLTVLEALKKALMSDLLTGRKRVSDGFLMAAE